jgi:hypothetical protein
MATTSFVPLRIALNTAPNELNRDEKQKKKWNYFNWWFSVSITRKQKKKKKKKKKNEPFANCFLNIEFGGWIQIAPSEIHYTKRYKKTEKQTRSM